MTILKVHYGWLFPSVRSIRPRSSQDQNFLFNFFFPSIHPIRAGCLTGAQSRMNDETSFSFPSNLLHVSTTTLRANSDSYNQCTALFSSSVHLLVPLGPILVLWTTTLKKCAQMPQSKIQTIPLSDSHKKKNKRKKKKKHPTYYSHMSKQMDGVLSKWMSFW